MFVKIKNKRINFDNVRSYWSQIDTFSCYTNGVKETNYYYNLYIQYVGVKYGEFLEESANKISFDTQDELNNIVNLLDHVLNVL